MEAVSRSPIIANFSELLAGIVNQCLITLQRSIAKLINPTGDGSSFLSGKEVFRQYTQKD